MNSTNGNLYAQKTPCTECTIVVKYRANDIGINRNRISPRSIIKLHVKKLLVSLFKVGGYNSIDPPFNYENNELDVNPAIKTFELRLHNSTRLGDFHQRNVINICTRLVRIKLYTKLNKLYTNMQFVSNHLIFNLF